MDRYTTELAEILREAEPKIFCSYEPIDIARYCMFYVMCKWGFERWIRIDGYEYDECSIEYLEKVYEKGYSAIVHDGKVIGYKKEKAL